jgi:Glyoxalase/Bleomycin resistance protein/Dioxygenase superfamily
MTFSTDRSLVAGFFQLGYVTRNLDSAIAEFRRRFGPAEFQIIEGTPQHPHTRRIGLAWIGETMTELIEPNPDVPSLYVGALPPAANGEIRFHHIGCLIDDYPDTLRRLRAEGYETPLTLSYGEVLDCVYADTRPQLGHYLEYIRLGEEGRKWFASVPGFQRFP